jgi:hypothetical protein
VSINGELLKLQVSPYFFQMNETTFKRIAVVNRLVALFEHKNHLGNLISLRHPDKCDIKYEDFKKYETYFNNEWDYLTTFSDINEVLFDIYENHKDWETIETPSQSFPLSNFALSSKNLLCHKQTVCLEILKSCGLPTDLIEARILNEYISNEAVVISSKGLQVVLKELSDIYS